MFLEENYWIYKQLINEGYIVINTKDITKENWQLHHDSIFNIMLDAIETNEIRHMFIEVIFNETKDSIQLSVFDYWQNLIFWYMIVAVDGKIMPYHLFFKNEVTMMHIKNYIDKHFILPNRRCIDVKKLNNIIDNSMYNFVKLDLFSMYLANTVNLSDFIDLMESNKEIYDIIHSDFSNIPLADIKRAGMEAMNRFCEIIKNEPDHCLCNFIKAGEGLNKKQAKEVIVNIGTKPDGQGGIFPYQINTNYFMNGVNELVPFFIESSVARISQIIINKNTGNAGYLSRLMGLNNFNAKLHSDPNYVCNVHPSNLQKLYIDNLDLLNSMVGQYYRLHPYGMEYVIEKDDISLVGKTIYKRSPMTCASAARGEGICYRCYGDLAYTVNNINIGKIAAEIISSIITQRMLSSKHLIDTEIIKMVWQDIFLELFEIDYNIIRLRDDMDYKGYKIQINLANKYLEYEEDDEIDDLLFSLSMNEYINEFEIIDPDGEIHKIYTQNYDNIYFTPELDAYIDENGKKIVDDIITIPLSAIQGLGIFAIRLENNDLTKALDKITGILDKSSEIAKYEKNSILQELLRRVHECNLNVSAVHCEVILMNQIRAKSDIKLKPNWSIENQSDYQILSLKKSLETNPSISISLMFQNIKRMFTDPLTFEKTAPGITDLFFMTKPQEYLSDEYVERTKEDNRYKQVIYYKHDFSK